MAKKRNRSSNKAPRGAGAPASSSPPSVSVVDAHDADRAEAASRRAKADARKGITRAPAATGRPDPTIVNLDPPREPVFWFGFEVSWAKLCAARFVMFAVLAIDALLQISHAPRYGAGGFNVAHIPGLDAIGPGRVGFEIGQLLLAYLFVYAALNIATRFVLPAAAAIYAWLYFGSQLDSYQHHYLVSLVLVIACFIPWQQPAEVTPATRIRTWAVRLLLVQLAILYLWAAISKMSPAWLDGRTINGQISGPLRSLIEHTIGWKKAARFALLTELILAATVWIRPTWIIALPLGIAFHVGILESGLDIGLFAYVMLAFYLVLIPDRVWIWLAETFPARMLRRGLRSLSIENPLLLVVATLFSLAASLALARFCRFDHAFMLAIGVSVLPIALVAGGRFLAEGRQVHRTVAAAGLAHVIAIGLWLVVDRSTTTTIDYYRYWGGSSRRLGDPAMAEKAYRRLTTVDPEGATGHFQLGRLLLDRGDDPAGLAELHEAQRLEPLDARAWMAEAQWLASKGRKAEAIEKAQEAVYSEPANQGTLDLLDSLKGTKSAPVAPSTTKPAGPSDDADDKP